METERLIIRNFRKADAEKCFENFGKDESLGRYLPMFPMTDCSEMETLIAGFITNPNVWVIEEKASHEPMGYITLDVPYESLKTGKIGYVLGKTYQHRGYAQEAVRAVLSHAFEDGKLYLIEAEYNEKNAASARLLNRLGFQTDGILRERRIDRETGSRINLVVCSIKQTELRGERDVYRDKQDDCPQF